MYDGVGRRSDQSNGRFLNIGQHSLNGYERDCLFRNTGDEHSGRANLPQHGVVDGRVASTRLPTEFGEFIAVAYEASVYDRTHLALVMGDVAGEGAVLVRMHSECLTSDVFRSRRCDCRTRFSGRRCAYRPGTSSVSARISSGRKRPGKKR